MKRKLIVIAGPTAVGKTNISIEVAKRVGGEIISADSMQIYKGMDIGTAKATADEMQGIKHHLIDELEPTEPYSVANFVKTSKERIDEICDKGKVPIIVGGTGFYLNALIYDNDFSDNTVNDEKIENGYITELRKELYEIAEKQGIKSLHNKLMEIDLISANNIPMQNVKRVVRAIEFFKLTGKKMSEHNSEERLRQSPYEVFFFLVDMPREKLYRRIEERIDDMISLGLVDEVKTLIDSGVAEDFVSMSGIGYKEIIPYLKGEMDLETCIQLLKRNTRRFAKRQLTWFRNQINESDVKLVKFNLDEIEKSCIIDSIESYI